MKIKVNGKTKTGLSAIVWSLFSLIILAMTLIWLAFIMLLLTSFIWGPFAIVILLLTR